MSRADQTAKQIKELKDYLKKQASSAGNQEAVTFLESVIDVVEALHFRLSDCEKECSQPESFIHPDVPHRLK